MKAATKSSLGLLGAIVIAGALGLYAYFGVLKPEERATEQQAFDLRLLPLASDAGAPSFDRLWITAGTETSALEKRAEGWFLTAPVEAKADPDVVRTLLHQLETGKVTEALEPNPTSEDLVRYGLAPPRFSVRATAGGSTEEHLIEGGIENPFDGSVFVRKAGKPTVYSAPGALRFAFAKSPFDLRDKRLLQVPIEELAALEVTHGKARYALTRQQGEWRLSKPQQAKADAEEVSSMLSSFGSERALAYPPQTPELRQRFEQPSLDATFQLASGRSIRIRIVGSEGASYALREEEGRATLAQVNPSAAAHLAKSFEALRDKKILTFDREAVRRITFSGTGETFELTKAPGTGNGWRLAQGPAQAFKVSTLLWTLSTLEGSRVVAEHAKRLSQYGLDRPARRVALAGDDGVLLDALSVGGEVRGSDRVYVGNEAGTVFEVDRAALTEVLLQPAELGETPAE